MRTQIARVIVAAVVVPAALSIGSPGVAVILPDWKGAESMALVSLTPNLDRCGAPPVLEARFGGDGLDSIGGVFTVVASGCINTETLSVFDLEATDVFAGGGSLLIRPHDTQLRLDSGSCIATNDEPVPFDVVGGTGRYAGATGSGTFHLAVSWAPCSGLNVPARVWFEGALSPGSGD